MLKMVRFVWDMIQPSDHGAVRLSLFVPFAWEVWILHLELPPPASIPISNDYSHHAFLLICPMHVSFMWHIPALALFFATWLLVVDVVLPKYNLWVILPILWSAALKFSLFLKQLLTWTWLPLCVLPSGWHSSTYFSRTPVDSGNSTWNPEIPVQIQFFQPESGGFQWIPVDSGGFWYNKLRKCSK